MDKIRKFCKENKKLLGIALISILLVSLICAVSYLLWDINNNTERNIKQLQKISQKYEQLNTYYGFAEEIETNLTGLEAQKIYDLIKLEPDSIANAELMEEYVSCLSSIDGLTVVNSELETIYDYGSVEETDYTDPYYTELFDADEGECTQIYSKGSDANEIFCIRFRDKYLIFHEIEGGYELPEVDSKTRWEIATRLVGVNKDSAVSIVDSTDNTVIYSEIKSLTGKKVEADLYSSNRLKADDETYFCVSYPDTEKNVCLCAITSLSSTIKSILKTIILIGILFGLTVTILVAYIICLQQGATDPSEERQFLGKYFLRSQVSKYSTVAIVCGLGFALMLLIVLNMQKNASNIAYLERENKACVESLDMLAKVVNDSETARDGLYYNYGHMANAYLNEYEDKLTKQGMAELADALDVKYISVLDGNGETICTSSSMDHINILDDEESPLYELRYVLMGREGMTVEADPEWMSDDEVILAVPRRGCVGVADGLIALTTVDGVSNTLLSNTQKMDITLPEMYRSEKGSILFAVDDTGIIITPAEVNDDVLSSAELAVEVDSLRDGFHGSLNLNGKQFIASVEKSESTDSYVYVIIPAEIINENILCKLIFSLVFFAVMSAFLCYEGLGSKTHFEKRVQKIKDADDWLRTELYWEELTTGQKMGRIIDKMQRIAGIVLIIAFILWKGGIVTDESVTYIASSDWNSSVNAYSIVVNLCIIIMIITIVKITKSIITRINDASEGELSTSSKVLCSMIDYVGAIAGAFIVLTNFGVDTITALASLGIVGFALSFGAQDLVKDMIAGLFILFEGNYKVGDMLSVNGEWYWVKAIGVRTTTLDAWGQIKVISNSQMTGLVNIQNSTACVDCDVMISNDQDLDEVEEIIRREIPKIKEKFPPKVGSPEYKGVQQLKAEGTVLRIRTYAPHDMQGMSGRTLRRELKRIFDDNNIILAQEAILVHTSTITSEDIKKGAVR